MKVCEKVPLPWGPESNVSGAPASEVTDLPMREMTGESPQCQVTVVPSLTLTAAGS